MGWRRETFFFCFFLFGLVWFGLGERDVWVWLGRNIVFFWGSFFSCFVGSFSLVGWGRGRRGLRKVVFMGKGGGECGKVFVSFMSLESTRVFVLENSGNKRSLYSLLLRGG